MKKTVITFLTAIILAFSVLLSACGKAQPDISSSNDANAYSGIGETASDDAEQNEAVPTKKTLPLPTPNEYVAGLRKEYPTINITQVEHKSETTVMVHIGTAVSAILELDGNGKIKKVTSMASQTVNTFDQERGFAECMFIATMLIHQYASSDTAFSYDIEGITDRLNEAETHLDGSTLVSAPVILGNFEMSYLIMLIEIGSKVSITTTISCKALLPSQIPPPPSATEPQAATRPTEGTRPPAATESQATTRPTEGTRPPMATEPQEPAPSVEETPPMTTKPVERPTPPKEPDPCENGHTWEDATCIDPRCCSVCHQTAGSALGHLWYDVKEIVEYEEIGHYETVTNARKVTKYQCPLCHERYSTLDGYYSHYDQRHTGSFNDYSFYRERYEAVSDWEYYDEQVWVIDQEAYTDVIITGQKCSRCGKTK